MPLHKNAATPPFVPGAPKWMCAAIGFADRFAKVSVKSIASPVLLTLASNVPLAAVNTADDT